MKAEPFKYKVFRGVLHSTHSPEAYNIFKGSAQVGYFRVLNGRFAAYRSAESNKPFYESRTDGDARFADHERENHLFAALDALEVLLKREKHK